MLRALSNWCRPASRLERMQHMSPKSSRIYTMPNEETEHESTWLQWPHDYGWDRHHVERYEPAWIEMTKALHTGERVSIISYNDQESRRIAGRLLEHGVDMGKIDFYPFPTDDVWVRDNGPIFVYDDRNELVLEDWRFNGWGQKAAWRLSNQIPELAAQKMNIDRVVVDMVNEGGSVEIDGRGTLMAKKSSILNRNRNGRMSQAQAEEFFRIYLGVTNFIWLEGAKGLEITDDHIDGTARFANGDTIATLARDDFEDPREYDILVQAKDAEGKPYKIVHLPLTSKKVPGTKWEGVYVNFYVGNDVVLVPTFDDPNDQKALDILSNVYPTRRVVGIDATKLFKDGGMIHCVTQQQPVRKTV